MRFFVTVLSRWVVKILSMKNEVQQNHEDRFWAISRTLFAEYESLHGSARTAGCDDLMLNSRISAEELEAVAGMLTDPESNRCMLDKKLRAIEAKIERAQAARSARGCVWPWSIGWNWKMRR